MPTALARVTATRYVLPLREGGSLPGLVEADDEGTYVVKLTGAGQGPRVLAAEVICSALAQVLDIPTPRLVVVDLPEAIARYEADEEVQDLLTASPGLNLGVDFLPGSFGYDGSVPPPPELAARILWLDALTVDVDRTWSNPNLLVWGGRVWAIDHGAALYVHHGWATRGVDVERFARLGYDADRHILRLPAGDLTRADAWCAARLTPEILTAAAGLVPDPWLPVVADQAGLRTPDEVRASYVRLLQARLDARGSWLPAPPGGPQTEGPADLVRSLEARRRWTR
ncbi:HipA family kinase [Arsenicicoccus dermatophilus]|uniref:HipA family kinase n=1 Tax=Arsenicicoccus dermatophilus TaxID=1076331 RepID=UPI001F4D1DC1|nr:HipA family kinase [Arsenicicoccus dermatophilus]MCH8612524.1 aminotransferase class I and II [Arsenicicoccus dermatophilus]